MVDVTDRPTRPTAARRRRWPWVVAVLAVVVVAAGIPTAIWFAHWRSSLHLLANYPVNGVGYPLAAGKTFYVDGNAVAARVFSHEDFSDLSVDINSVRPVVKENTADADIGVLRCVLRRDGGGPFGYNQAQTRRTCGTITPFHSGPVTLGFRKGDDDIVIAVTPRHAGTVRISGVEVQYSSGLRHGTQHTGPQIKTTTK